MKDYNKLKKYLEDWDILLSESQITQFDLYYEMLIERNKVMNLTAITDFEDVLVKHFADSVSLIKVVDLYQTLSLIDIGTGAGFPSIPLKIVFPSLKVVMLDSLGKRVNFLKEVIERLKLQNIEPFHGRAEEFGRNKEYREQFDLCVSRAVSNMATLTEYCMPFVKAGGKFIPYKSGKVFDELENAANAITILGGKLDRVETFYLPESDMERSLVVINKMKSTPGKYPRNGGKPLKEPIV